METNAHRSADCVRSVALVDRYDSGELVGAPDLPARPIGDATYEARWARTPADVDAVLRLRFEVFNVELAEGLETSYATGRDEDAFDAACRHLMVVERASGRVVGTYRMQTSAMAAAACGFYSATQFDLSRLPAGVVEDSVEIGRACVARPHRNTRVFFLLWKGLAAYAAHNEKRYLFGCCSLASRDEADARAVARLLAANGHVDASLDVRPLPGFVCEADGRVSAEPHVPPLFGMYLRHGGVVCGAPALDRAFRTIDFFLLFDVERMRPRARALFFG